ncbi:hypothetical protein IFM89_012034, partial [Coptis chinensis]
MEKEDSSTVSMKNKLGFLDVSAILKKATNILWRIPKFIAVGIQTVLPMYYTDLLHPIIIKDLLSEMSKRLRTFPIDTNLFSWFYISTLYFLKTNLFYMVQFHLPILLTAVLTGYLCSVMEDEGRRLLKLRETLLRLVSIAKWKGPLLRFIVLSFTSFVSYVIIITCLVFGGYFVTSNRVFNTVLYTLSFVAALIKWMEFNAIWNVGAAISKVTNGFEESSKFSAYYKARKVQASVLLLLHFNWCFSASISWLPLEGINEQVVYSIITGAVLYASLIWGKEASFSRDGIATTKEELVETTRDGLVVEVGWSGDWTVGVINSILPTLGTFFMILYGAGSILLILKWMDWSVVWNMSILFSVLDDKHGVEAFEASGYFSRGNKKRGFQLMLIFFVWRIVLRLSCVYVGGHEKWIGLVATSFLSCVGNVMKWVVCVVYFYDCKKRVLEKKVDVEEGR